MRYSWTTARFVAACIALSLATHANATMITAGTLSLFSGVSSTGGDRGITYGMSAGAFGTEGAVSNEAVADFEHPEIHAEISATVGWDLTQTYCDGQPPNDPCHISFAHVKVKASLYALADEHHGRLLLAGVSDPGISLPGAEENPFLAAVSGQSTIQTVLYFFVPERLRDEDQVFADLEMKVSGSVSTSVPIGHMYLQTSGLETASDIDPLISDAGFFTDILHVRTLLWDPRLGYNPDVNLFASLQIDPIYGGNFADLSHTAQIKVTVPDGVTFACSFGPCLVAQAVPEPGTLELFAVGLLGLLGFRSRFYSSLSEALRSPTVRLHSALRASLPRSPRER